MNNQTAATQFVEIADPDARQRLAIHVTLI